MKSNTLHLRRAIFCFAFFFGIIGGDWGQTFTDNASNSAYSSGWNNSSNGGSGFQAWTLSSDGGNAGQFIGDPSNAGYGMSSSGIGSTAFGLYGHSSHYAYALRNFSSSIAVGDILSFHWSMNYDCGSSGSKGWELRSGSTNVFGVSNTNSSVISYNGIASGTVSSNYGISAMLVSIQRTSNSHYSVSITRRNTADGTFSTNISSSLAIDNLRIYIGSQQTNEGQRNIFFNNFQIQKPDQYRSKTSGNWSSAGSWEVSTNGGSTWSTAASPPGSTMYSTITIVSGHTISQNQLYTAGSNNNIVVESGGILNMTGATGNFQFNSLSVSGNLIRNNTSYVYSGTITVNNGGKYIHAINGSSIPNCTWNNGSTLEITGVTNEIPIATGNYQNVIWNCANQSLVGDWSVFENNFNTINGNFNIVNTGVGTLIIGNSSTDRTMTVLGDFDISNGFFAIKGGTSSSGNIKLIVNGNFIQSGGTFRPSRRASASTGTAILELKGNFQQIGGIFENSSIYGSGNVAFAKTGIQLFTKTSGTIASEINFTVNNGSTLDIGTSILDGSSGVFTLSSGGGLITANTAGITSTGGATGSIQVGGTRTYNTGANYTFNGSSAQVTGNGFTGAANFTVNNSAGVTLTSNTSLSGILTLTNGVLTVGSTNTITVSSGGSINATSGSLASGTGAGTFTFSGTGTISGTIGFNHVNIAGGVNFGSASTINGTLSINTGGYVSTSAPIYASGSTLKYNSGGTYGRGTEWSATSAAGYPHHVQISNNTTLNFANGSNTPRSIAGNLTIDAASTLTMESLTTNSSTIGLTVGGNINNSGTISMSETTERIKCTDFTNIGGSTTNLSTEIGGDLEVTGNLVENGNLNSSSRAVFFTGTGTQDVQGSGTFSIDYIVLNKVSGSVRLLCDLICEGPNGGNAMTLTNATDIIDLNVYALTIGKAAVNSGITGLGYVKTSSSSSLTIRGTGNFGTLNFDPSSTAIGSFTLNRTETNAGATIGGHLTATNLTITSGNLTITAGKQLTVNGVLTNNGILTINSGATLVQGSSSTLSGSGTYNVKQTVTGAGSGTPSGRFWYVGSPVSTATSAVYDAAGANILKYYSEPANAWQEITANNAALEVGRGYFVQAAAGTTELNFTGGTINNGDYPLNVTRNTTTNAFRGYNLLTNPYPSYLDWDNVTRSNVGTTMWYRAENLSGTMVFDTYNVSAGTGTNNNGAGAVTRYIPPMQSFWVNVPQGQTTGTISFGNAQRSHYSTGVQGLRSSAQDFPAFLRLNLLDGSFVDQTILYMKPAANNTFDEYDSEKMFLGGVPQFYSTVNAKKLVLNGMKNQKARTSVPLTMELPTSKSYTFQAEEFNIEDGLILLEDKQEGVIQDLTINPTYSFFGNAGTNATRFVVHFQLATTPVLVGGPQELESLGSDELVSENIQIVSNNQGTVIVRLDEGFKPEGSIRIFDASGRLVEQTDFNDHETTIQLNEQAGMYFVEVSSGKLMVKRKIVIE